MLANFFVFHFFSKLTFSRTLYQCQTVWIPIGPNLDPNYLHMLSADDTSRQRVNSKWLHPTRNKISSTCMQINLNNFIFDACSK